MNAKVAAVLKPRFYLPVLLLIAFVLIVVWLRGRGGDALQYRSEAVDRGDITQTVSANGTLNPVTLVSVGTQVSGTVKKLFVDFNDRVEAGQVLVMLDDALLKAALTQDSANLSAAENALRVANNNRARVRELAKEGFVSQQELDAAEQSSQDAQAKVTQLRAAVEKDRANVGYSVIRSPVSGVVVSRAVDEGQTVAASFSTPELFKIAKDLREMQIDAYFAEADIGQIKLGQQVKFRVDAFTGQRFTGNVKQIRLNPKTESNVVTYDVVIAVANMDEKLLPGMTAYVDIGVQQRQDVLRVPNTALRFKPTDESVIEKAAEEKPENKSAGSDAVAETGPAAGEKGEQQHSRRDMSDAERAAWKAKRQAEGGDDVRQQKAANADSKQSAEAQTADAAEGGRKGRRNSAATMGRVYVLRDGKLVELRVRTGITDRRFTELKSDELKEGDQIVVEELDAKAGNKAGGQQRGMQFGM